MSAPKTGSVAATEHSRATSRESVLTTFVLVDFENIQRINVALLKGGPLTIKVFLGQHQSNVPLELARALQSFGSESSTSRLTATERTRLICRSRTTTTLIVLPRRIPEPHFRSSQRPMGSIRSSAT